MKKIILIILAAVLVGGFFTYNNLVTLNEQIDGQWAQVETQYQRRIDLIPNLVESVKGVMNQEKAIFTALAEARTRYSSAQNSNDKALAAGQIETSLGRLLAIIENYPTLKSSDNVNTLMAQLEGTENRISVERKNYNELVQDFNARIKRVPTNLFASMLGFEKREYFESVPGSENAPKVDLGQ